MVKNRPRRDVLFALFKLWSFIIFLFPIRAGLFGGRCLGRIAFLTLKKERKLALNNLDTAFRNSKSLKEKTVIVRELFENLGKNLVEVASLTKFNSGNIDKYIECKGLEVIQRFVREKRGGIILSAHFGNWEFLAHYFAIKGYRVNVIARRLRMQQFENALDRIRKLNKVSILYRDASPKEVIDLLKKNEFVGIMPDQDMDSVSGVFVDFFGKPAYTPNGPAVLSVLTGSPIIPCFIVRKSFGHQILIGEPLKLSASGDKKKDILENTQRYTTLIENYIRRFPSQWVWFHERWKTRPTRV